MWMTSNPERRHVVRERGLARGLFAGMLALPVVLALPGDGSSPSESEQEATDGEVQLTARQTLEKALAMVSDILLANDLPKPEKRHRVQSLIESSVDFDRVSKLVLARNWQRFSDDEQPQFVSLFKRHLVSTYWKNADYSDFAGIEVTGDRQEQRRDWTVLTVIKNKHAEDARIDYRLRQLGKETDPNGEWKIIDILVEGVSLVSNFRSQFQSIVNNSGPAQLIAELEKKVAEAEAAESKADSN